MVLRPDLTRYASWNHWDRNLRICSADTFKTIQTASTYSDDVIVSCSTSSDGSLLVAGGVSSLVHVWEIVRDKRSDIRFKASLAGHIDEVTCVQYASFLPFYARLTRDVTASAKSFRSW